MLLLQTAAEFFPAALLNFTTVDLALNVAAAIETLQPCLEQWAACRGGFKHSPHRPSKLSRGPKDNEAAEAVTAWVIEQERVRIHAVLSSYSTQPPLGKTSAKLPWFVTPESRVNAASCTLCWTGAKGQGRASIPAPRPQNAAPSCLYFPQVARVQGDLSLHFILHFKVLTQAETVDKAEAKLWGVSASQALKAKHSTPQIRGASAASGALSGTPELSWKEELRRLWRVLQLSLLTLNEVLCLKYPRPLLRAAEPRLTFLFNAVHLQMWAKGAACPAPGVRKAVTNNSRAAEGM